jgi:excisionase family DNA binding protein
MGRELANMAERLGCSERTLRRCINEGVLRGRRLGPRHVELPLDEQRYAETHWELVQMLRTALRTEPSVRLAVLFGSAATGEDGPGSDADVLVSFQEPAGLQPLALGRRLGRALDRRVQVITLAQGQQQPSLFADVLAEGRVLVDRDGMWASLKHDEADVLHRARAQETHDVARARAALAQARQRL